MNICKCIHCNEFMEDINPDVNAVGFTEDHLKAANANLLGSMVWDEKEEAYVCANCNTDKYLKAISKLPLVYTNPFSTGENPFTITEPISVDFIDTGCFIVERNVPFGKQYDYVVNDICITQRCGKSIKLFKLLKRTKCSPKDYELKFRLGERVRSKE